uniref:Uncharacterized protein n=1 Tax=Triticum urartu TaxID=4572 RepID=A0A8R7QF38_TRIUA
MTRPRRSRAAKVGAEVELGGFKSGGGVSFWVEGQKCNFLRFSPGRNRS